MDTSSNSYPRNTLASCETLRKRALVSRDGQQVQEVISHGIGSVFCDPAHRGKGYASRMLSELGKILDTWQQQHESKADFTVLFSDIGKVGNNAILVLTIFCSLTSRQDFYTKHGWKAFPSSHISLPAKFAEGDMSWPIPDTTAIRAPDLAELCRLDEESIRAKLSSAAEGPSKVRVALIPDAQTMQWHHAREEFAAKEMFGRTPDVKGAMAQDESSGERVWCIWTRTYGNDRAGNTLNILRLVTEGVEEDLMRQGPPAANNAEPPNPSTKQKIHATSLVLQAAQHEAAKWGMKDVQLWNPTHLCVLAAQQIKQGITVVHRDEESIASLRWHGEEVPEGWEVEWVGNEKFGWC